jgi:carbon monoxide dehydrogenase subunit G
MHFENKATIPVSRDSLWTVLMDMEQVARCLPGVEDVNAVDPDNYLGILKMRVGPIGLKLEGKVSVTERNRDAWRAAMRAEGNERGVGGAVKATIAMQLNELAPSETEMLVTTDAQVMGKMGEFGQPVMRKKADSMMQEFSRNVAQLASTGTGRPA